MKLFGLRIERYSQWGEVLRRENRVMDWPSRWLVLKDIVKAVLTGRKKRWFRKMLKCHRCSIFDPELKRCRPFDGSKFGCGCWAPAAALFKEHGWLTTALGDPENECW